MNCFGDVERERGHDRAEKRLREQALIRRRVEIFT